MKDKNYFMRIALKEAEKGMEKGEGGPFGAVIVKDGEIISKAHNEVLKTNDPTAHAEMVAIRRASKKLGRFNLSDCDIYSTCEPCPMCFSAIHWAKIKKLYFLLAGMIVLYFFFMHLNFVILLCLNLILCMHIHQKNIFYGIRFLLEKLNLHLY